MTSPRWTNASNNARRRRRERAREALNAIKVASGCIDCGYNAHPAALHFDHRDPSTKTLELCKSTGHAWEVVLAEIAKCDVRCANCHAVRTHESRHHMIGKVVDAGKRPLFVVGLDS